MCAAICAGDSARVSAAMAKFVALDANHKPTNGKRYSEAFKARVLTMVSRIGVAKVVRLTGVNLFTVYRWMRAAGVHAPNARQSNNRRKGSLPGRPSAVPRAQAVLSEMYGAKP